jgi:hypothetical protein
MSAAVQSEFQINKPAATGRIRQPKQTRPNNAVTTGKRTTERQSMAQIVGIDGPGTFILAVANIQWASLLTEYDEAIDYQAAASPDPRTRLRPLHCVSKILHFPFALGIEVCYTLKSVSHG